MLLRADGTVKATQVISYAKGRYKGRIDPGDRFGDALANLGDLNGDGAVDLAVGSHGYEEEQKDLVDTGAVMILGGTMRVDGWG